MRIFARPKKTHEPRTRCMYVSSFRLHTFYRRFKHSQNIFFTQTMHFADIGIGKTTEKTEINGFKLMDKYFLQLDNSLGTRNCVDS